jgi:invasion protein IalB
MIAAALAAVLAFATAASAQQQSAPPKPKSAKPAPKQGTSKPDQEAAAVPGDKPALVGQYGEWGAYVAQSGGSKLCFALANPASAQTKPPTTSRDPVYFFVATRPAENVRNEVSVMIGYAFKPGTDATVEIGPAKFAMYTQNDGAWIKNAAEEARLIETMRKGTDLVVTGTSSRGTQSVDRYSLKGLAQALDRTAKECGAAPTARGR